MSKWFQIQREAFIQQVVDWGGRINRRDIMDKFDVSAAQASIDLNRFIEGNPQALTYDKKAKCYRANREAGVGP